ncbi:MAG: hypothetical protein EBZ49_06295 [Proteobacteria bacterium]|nr:hypothetical protein [Pseudomonadota bacterium]
MKLASIVNPKFTVCFDKLLKEELPILTAYKLKKITSIVESEQKKFEELRQELVKKFSKKNKKGEPHKNEGGFYSVDKDKMEDFLKELKTLLDVEVEVPKIKISDLGNELKISAEQAIALDGILEE